MYLKNIYKILYKNNCKNIWLHNKKMINFVSKFNSIKITFYTKAKFFQIIGGRVIEPCVYYL